MLGAIIGDIVGSRFEFNNTDNKDFQLFTDECQFTDDTICTVAIAYALANGMDYGESLRSWCGLFPLPMGGYGGRFSQWIWSDDPQPYNSFGNGAAMRVSPVAWWFDSLDEVLEEAEKTALPTHNHPEGVKGAKAVAHAIYALRTGPIVSGLYREVLHNVCTLYYHDGMSKKFPRGVFDETCMGTVPLAFQIVDGSHSFEDAIRNAVAWGGDSDTLAAIVGSIAEAIWPVPEVISNIAFAYLPGLMDQNVGEFYKALTEKRDNNG